MSERVRVMVAPHLAGAHDAIARERVALAAFLGFARDHKELYRIIDEAEFVAPEAYRRHYETVAARIAARLEAGAGKGELQALSAMEREVLAWASMGMNVFLGLRFSVWGKEDPDEVAAIANRILNEGLKP
jgi:hypothetical protein